MASTRSLFVASVLAIAGFSAPARAAGPTTTTAPPSAAALATHAATASGGVGQAHVGVWHVFAVPDVTPSAATPHPLSLIRSALSPNVATEGRATTRTPDGKPPEAPYPGDYDYPKGAKATPGESAYVEVMLPGTEGALKHATGTGWVITGNVEAVKAAYQKHFQAKGETVSVTVGHTTPSIQLLNPDDTVDVSQPPQQRSGYGFLTVTGSKRVDKYFGAKNSLYSPFIAVLDGPDGKPGTLQQVYGPLTEPSKPIQTLEGAQFAITRQDMLDTYSYLKPLEQFGVKLEWGEDPELGKTLTVTTPTRDGGVTTIRYVNYYNSARRGKSFATVRFNTDPLPKGETSAGPVVLKTGLGDERTTAHLSFGDAQMPPRAPRKSAAAAAAAPAGTPAGTPASDPAAAPASASRRPRHWPARPDHDEKN